MAKKKVIFECTACGYQSPKWMGKCPNCGAWNSMEESLEQKTAHPKHGVRTHKTTHSKIQTLNEVKNEKTPRIL
ncbi:DNA repair protein RadA, partial [Staphylococcus equorum]